jgi:hypothetical protein
MYKVGRRKQEKRGRERRKGIFLKERSDRIYCIPSGYKHLEWMDPVFLEGISLSRTGKFVNLIQPP